MSKSAGSLEVHQAPAEGVDPDAAIARLVDEIELQAMKQYRRDYGAGVPHAVRIAKLLTALDNAQLQAETRWRQYRRRDQRRIPLDVRAEILQDDCVYCGAEATTIDHILPVSRGGTRDRDNLAAACAPCNNEKADRTVAEWMRFRAEQGLPWPPTTPQTAELS